MVPLLFLLVGFKTVFAKDVVQVIAYKKEKSPAVQLDEHSPNKMSFNT